MLLLLAYLPYILALAIFVHLLSNYWRLRQVPGPFLANFTDLYRLWVVWSRQSHDIYLDLHKKYGDVVRIGPNCVSVIGPGVKDSIYGIGKGFIKSDYYTPLQNIVNGQRVASLVAMTDEAEQTRTRRPIARAYALTTLVEYAPLVDSTIAVFVSRLDELFANTGNVCDLALWLQLFAFDLIGELTFSKRLGFLASGGDVEGIIASIGKNFDRTSVLGQMPVLDLLWYKNPIYLNVFGKARGPNSVVGFGMRRLEERLNSKNSEMGEESIGMEIKDPELRAKDLERQSGVEKPDFLSRFLELRASENEKDHITDSQLLAHLFMNINAGSDTTASILRAIFYHLLKAPASLQRLWNELDAAVQQGTLSMPFATWPETQALPYLCAVVKEGLRIHPALGLPLERIVPAEGLHVQEYFLPHGTIVGINPWIQQRHPHLFGADAEEWRPERWMPDEGDEDGAERVKVMEHELLVFGAGKRGCLGRNIAMLELHKLLPCLLVRYDFELTEETKSRGWRLRNSWLVGQEGVDVRIRRRNRD
ncbi:putative P450 monooxygenase [Aulographum hederae CBS 113979]|uniref:Putative P450 monooxygenase n=1 Tax=Aulographum hederae CBS 113979 TaxID=1176131 RepID=A0A6G1H247_9PEZI|nr:putative P450 monooxygenase [Aulographum hederae CBS 113979]